jgi:hypothetical protein
MMHVLVLGFDKALRAAVEELLGIDQVVLLVVKEAEVLMMAVVEVAERSEHVKQMVHSHQKHSVLLALLSMLLLPGLLRWELKVQH